MQCIRLIGSSIRQVFKNNGSSAKDMENKKSGGSCEDRNLQYIDQTSECQVINNKNKTENEGSKYEDNKMDAKC